MADDIKTGVAQATAWMAVFLGGISLEVWIAVIGLLISAFISYTNYRSRKFQDRLLAEQAIREKEWHKMEKERLELLKKMPSLAGVDDVSRVSRPPEIHQ